MSCWRWRSARSASSSTTTCPGNDLLFSGDRCYRRHMAHFPKPAEGSWTEHFDLDTGPVSYEDSISPAHYELEREAIFGRTWLNVGRVEQLPNPASYFSNELDPAST